MYPFFISKFRRVFYFKFSNDTKILFFSYRHRKESEKLNFATFRHAYTQQTLQGEQLVQNLYLKLKDGQFKAAENETKFYYLVSDIITKKVEREEKRFQSLEVSSFRSLLF